MTRRMTSKALAYRTFSVYRVHTDRISLGQVVFRVVSPAWFFWLDKPHQTDPKVASCTVYRALLFGDMGKGYILCDIKICARSGIILGILKYNSPL